MSQRVLFFDGVCNLCNFWVDFLMRRPGLPADVRFCSLQSETAKKLLSNHDHLKEREPLSTVVLGEWNHSGAVEFYFESDAALRILTSLGGVWSIFNLAFWIPRSLRNRVYRWVAARRYQWFGQRSTCRVPTATERARFLE